MPATKFTITAFLWLLGPLAILHVLTLSNTLIVPSQDRVMNPLPVTSPDAALSMLGLRFSLDVLLVAGAVVLAARFWPGRDQIYAVAGGVGAGLAYTVALQIEAWPVRPPPGTILVGALFVILAGSIGGFLFGRFAPRRDPCPVEGAPNRQLYDGPVQVRTSFWALVGAALSGPTVAVMFAALAFATMDWRVALGLPGFMLVTSILVTFVPLMLGTLAMHLVLRVCGRTGYVWYAGGGAMLGAATSLSLSSFFVWPVSAALGVLTMCVYRRLAGLEPKSFPEPVIVRDRAHLLPSDAIERRMRAVQERR